MGPSPLFLILGPGRSTEHPGLSIISTNSLWEPRRSWGPPKETGAGHAERIAEAAGEPEGRRCSVGAGAFLFPRESDELGSVGEAVISSSFSGHWPEPLSVYKIILSSSVSLPRSLFCHFDDLAISVPQLCYYLPSILKINFK